MKKFKGEYVTYKNVIKTQKLRALRTKKVTLTQKESEDHVKIFHFFA